MCMTLYPAKLSNTIIYAAEVKKNDKTVHVLGYQNKVKADVDNYNNITEKLIRAFSSKKEDKPIILDSKKSKVNAMILPIPSAQPLGPDNIVDTRQFKYVLNNYANLFEVRYLSKSYSLNDNVLYSAASIQIIESGNYTVVLTSKPSLMREGILQLPEEKRPIIPDAFLDKIEELYSDWPIAICCFDKNLDEPEPLLWWYEPKFPETLFAPGLDAHDGNPPEYDQRVARDHTLIFGSYHSAKTPSSISLNVPEEHKWMFLDRIVGRKITGNTSNGDFRIPIVTVIHKKDLFLNSDQISIG